MTPTGNDRSRVETARIVSRGRRIGPMEVVQRHNHRASDGSPLDDLNECVQHLILDGRPSGGASTVASFRSN